MKVSILTLGCRVNQSESAIIEGTLKENGVTIVNLNESPDYCVVNTCTVTARGDYNSRQLIRRAAKAGAKVLVTGCYSQLRPDEVQGLPGVYKLVDNKKKLNVVDDIIGVTSQFYYGYCSRTRPYLKVQDGCNFRCSYCAVPLARGKSESIPEDAVVERARIIQSAGYHELVLTGIHLGSYGYDLRQKSSLGSLLERLLKETSLRRIRLSSLEISEIDDRIIELLSSERLCKHLHLPLQSGSERVLGLMNRRYTLKTFSRTVEKIADRIDNVAIGTDVIAGFPGETEDDFSHTLVFLRNHPFSYLHIFPFSSRPHTAAVRLPHHVDPHDIKGRAQRLSELDRLKRHEYMVRQLDRRLDVIIEGEEGETSLGTSGNYLKVRVLMNTVASGSLVFVRPVAVNDGMLEASLIQKS